MYAFLRSLFVRRDSARRQVQEINALRAELARQSDADLRSRAQGASGRLELMAATAVVAARVLGQEMFDVQLRGALALTEGRIAEMQTGEGKNSGGCPGSGLLRAGKAGRPCNDGE